MRGHEARAGHPRDGIDFEYDEFALAVQNHVGAREVAAFARPVHVQRGLADPFENLGFDFRRRDFDAGSGAVLRVVVEEFALGKNDFGGNEGSGVRSGSNDSAGELAAGDEFLHEDFASSGEFFFQNLPEFFF